MKTEYFTGGEGEGGRARGPVHPVDRELVAVDAGLPRGLHALRRLPVRVPREGGLRRAQGDRRRGQRGGSLINMK